MSLGTESSGRLSRQRGVGRQNDSPFAYAPGSHRFVRGERIYLYDAGGNKWLDANAGTFNVSMGYGNPRVVEAVRQALNSGIAHGPSSFANEHVANACEELVSIAPANIDCCHMKGCTGGSTAVEQAVRSAVLVAERECCLAYRQSHHGQTIATTMISGMPFRRERLPSTSFPVVHVKPPDCFRCPWERRPDKCKLECVDHIEEEIENAPKGAKAVGVGIFEPILGAGGGITPPLRYWPEVVDRLRKRKIRVIFDEAQTWGRTATKDHFFFAQYYGVQPDLLTVAKGITGIGLAGGAAVLMPRHYAKLRAGERSLTGGANPLVCAAITETIRIMKDVFFRMHQRAAAEALSEGLHRLQSRFSCVGIVRGAGLMTGLEIVKPDSVTRDVGLTHRIIQMADRNRLLLRNSEYGRGSFIKIRPALNITEEEVQDLLERLEKSIEDALS